MQRFRDAKVQRCIGQLVHWCIGALVEMWRGAASQDLFLGESACRVEPLCHQLGDPGACNAIIIMIDPNLLL